MLHYLLCTQVSTTREVSPLKCYRIYKNYNKLAYSPSILYTPILQSSKYFLLSELPPVSSHPTEMCIVTSNSLQVMEKVQLPSKAKCCTVWSEPCYASSKFQYFTTTLPKYCYTFHKYESSIVALSSSLSWQLTLHYQSQHVNKLKSSELKTTWTQKASSWKEIHHTPNNPNCTHSKHLVMHTFLIMSLNTGTSEFDLYYNGITKYSDTEWWQGHGHACPSTGGLYCYF